MTCRYGEDCLRANCWGDHPNGTWKEKIYNNYVNISSQLMAMEKQQAYLWSQEKQMKDTHNFNRLGRWGGSWTKFGRKISNQIWKIFRKYFT